MCSQRDHFAIFGFHAGPRGSRGWRGGTAWSDSGSSMSRFAIVDGRTRNLLVPLQLELFGLAVELQFLAHDLVGAMFTRRLDVDDVFTRFDGLARVVLAVPLERVLAGRARGAGDGGGDVVAFGHGA